MDGDNMALSQHSYNKLGEL